LSDIITMNESVGVRRTSVWHEQERWERRRWMELETWA